MGMTDDQRAILKRLKRKAEVSRLDLKAKNDPRHYDMNEILSLLDILERTMEQ